MRGLEVGGRHANRFGRQCCLVDFRRVFEYRGETLVAHIAADALDNLGRGQRGAKDLDRALLARLADDVAAWAQLVAQLRQGGAKVVAARVELRQAERVCSHGGCRFGSGETSIVIACPGWRKPCCWRREGPAQAQSSSRALARDSCKSNN